MKISINLKLFLMSPFIATGILLVNDLFCYGMARHASLWLLIYLALREFEKE